MLATSRLKLRKFGNADTARVVEICGDYRVASMCRVVPHPYDASSASFFINTVCTQMDGLVLAIETLADGKLIGCISIEGFRPDDEGDSGGTVATLGYWLAWEAWGVGFATEAASAIVDYAFSNRGFAALESGYWAENAASARVQSKLGFRVVRRGTAAKCVARGCELDEVRTRLERAAWQATKEAPKPPPVILRQFLSDDDILKVQGFARQMTPVDDDEGGGGDVSGWTRYGDAHEALFLHHGGLMHDDDVWRTFQQAQPELFASLQRRVRDAADAAGLCAADAFDEQLSVRCIEYHTYTAGGALLDKSHCDLGSVLTLSVLLTEPGDGGVFSTSDATGVKTMHDDIGRGDAIVLDSEMVHNVSTLRSGERRSLVIEWWRRPANRRDRFS